MVSQLLKQIALIFLLLIAGNFSAQSPAPSTVNDIPTVPYCDLIRDAASYNSIPVRIKATWLSGFEASFIFDKDCSEKKDLSWVGFEDNENLCAVTQENLKSHKDNGGASIVTAVGKLYHKGGYGHMNSYKYKFVISCLEEIKPFHPDNK
jgi:hypothetical protein